MGNFEFNVALGRTAELYHRVKTNDPTNAALIILAITTTSDDNTLRKLDTLAAVLADPNTAEVTNINYARKVLVDADLNALSPDDTNNQMKLDFPDQLWATVAPGDTWTDLLICYDPDTTAGDDTAIIPMTQHDFIYIHDGSDVGAILHTDGFYRAEQVPDE